MAADGKGGRTMPEKGGSKKTRSVHDEGSCFVEKNHREGLEEKAGGRGGKKHQTTEEEKEREKKKISLVKPSKGGKRRLQRTKKGYPKGKLSFGQKAGKRSLAEKSLLELIH